MSNSVTLFLLGVGTGATAMLPMTLPEHWILAPMVVCAALSISGGALAAHLDYREKP